MRLALEAWSPSLGVLHEECGAHVDDIKSNIRGASDTSTTLFRKFSSIECYFFFFMFYYFIQETTGSGGGSDNLFALFLTFLLHYIATLNFLSIVEMNMSVFIYFVNLFDQNPNWSVLCVHAFIYYYEFCRVIIIIKLIKK